MEPGAIGALAFGLIFLVFVLAIISVFLLKRKSRSSYYDDQPYYDNKQDLNKYGAFEYTPDEKELKNLAKRLTNNGWVLHSKSTCPWCIKQIDMFGHSAKYLNIKQCDEGCDGVHLYPTWVNGPRNEPGSRSVENLKDFLKA